MNNEYNNKSERITRTNVVYYDKCPNCGAPREHDEETCPYCQQSLIKSKEVIKEVEVEKETPTIVNNINNSNVINNYRKKNVINGFHSSYVYS